MITVKEYKHLQIPIWALSYLVNDDASGITEEDKILVDKYMNRYYDFADAIDCHVIFAIETYEEDFEEAEQLLIDYIDDVLQDTNDNLTFSWLKNQLENVCYLQKIKDEYKEPYFTWKPAFGLASDVVECTILICK